MPADGDKRIVKKRCWQCGSNVQIYQAKFKIWNCPKDCGPESLGKLFKLGGK